MDHSFVLNLRSVPKVKSVRRIPGMEISRTKGHGALYVIKYFLDAGHGPIMIRFTSKHKSFKQLYTFDICNKRLIPTIGIDASKMKQDTILNLLGDLISNIKDPAQVKESYTRSAKSVIQEFVTAKTVMGIVQDPGLRRLVKFIVFFLGIRMGVEILLAYRYVFKKAINWLGERYVAGPLEREINEKLFAGQKEEDTAFARYQALVTYIKHVTVGKGIALIICGPPGMSKTYIVKRTLFFQKLRPRVDYVVEKGSTLGLADAYYLLFVNRKKILILDDFDKPLQNEDMINFLKSITDSYEKRILSLPREERLELDQAGSAAPQKFEFKGKLIIITNLNRDQIDKALLSRAPAIEVNFNSKEILESLQELIDYINPKVPKKIKLEVYQYILKLYKMDPHITLDFRVFVTSLDARIGNPVGWKDMVKVIVNFRK